MKTSKILLFVMLSIAMLSCKKEPKDTTFQIVNNSTFETSTMPYLDGSLYQVVILCYKGSDLIKQENITSLKPGGGKSIIFVADPNAEKLKVGFKFLPPESAYYSGSSNNYKYTAAFFMITKNTNNTIDINDNTLVTSIASIKELNVVYLIQSLSSCRR